MPYYNYKFNIRFKLTMEMKYYKIGKKIYKRKASTTNINKTKVGRQMEDQNLE